LAGPAGSELPRCAVAARPRFGRADGHGARCIAPEIRVATRTVHRCHWGNLGPGDGLRRLDLPHNALPGDRLAWLSSGAAGPGWLLATTGGRHYHLDRLPGDAQYRRGKRLD